jgi:hypothetical protein
MYDDLVLKQQKIKELANNLDSKDKEKLDILDEKYYNTFVKMNKKDIELINKNKTNIFTFHNHNLAYYCWKKLSLGGKLQNNNLLLHFDSHRDLTIPKIKEINSYKEYINNLKTEKDKLKVVEHYATNKLWIADYIFPAMKENIINEIFWIEPDNMQLGIGPKLLKNVFFDKEKIGFTLTPNNNIPITTMHAKDIQKNIKDKNIILSIDIDYFSCTENPKNIATKQEIISSINKITSTLKKIKKPEVTTIALSPDYVPYDQIEFIKTELEESIKKTD